MQEKVNRRPMKNMFGKRSKDGFTLAEVLATVAIILILAGVTFVSVVQYQKNLRLMEMDGTAKEIFIAAQNHLSLAEASGDLDRLAMQSTGTGSAADSAYGTSISAPSYAGDSSGQYYYVIHNAAQGAGSETYIPAQGTSVYDLLLPFGALDGTVQQGGNYAIVYERKSASVVAVLYSGAGNASFGNAATIQLSDDDVKNIATIYNDKAKRKSYVKDGNTVIVGCYTGKAGSNADLDTKTLEAPKLEVKNEAKLHAVVSGNYTDNEQITLYIKGLQSGALASKTVDWKKGDTSIDITIDDITGDGKMRFTNLCGDGRFALQDEKKKFIVGEDIEVYAEVSAKDALATPKQSETITTNSLFDRKTEKAGASEKNEVTLYIRNLRHLENLGKNISGYNAGKKSATDANNVTAVQEKNITGFSTDEWNQLNGHSDKKIYGMEQPETFAAINVKYPMTYDGQNHEIYGVKVGTQPTAVQNDNDHNDRTAAGIFGFIDNTFTAKNLILRNNQVSGATNAGMLAGEVRADLTVEDVLAYYHEDEYNEANDSKVEVSATNVAGGLIGLVTGGTLQISDSAASVYVKAGVVKDEVLESGVAGGFIGSTAGTYIGDQASARGGSIQRCYAGGHTKNGAYDTELDDKNKNQIKNTGSGRYNVQAGGYAGGFIGMSTTKVEMDAVYATTSVYSSNDVKSESETDSDSKSVSMSGSFCGSASNTLNIKKDSNSEDAKLNYYAVGPHTGMAASSDDVAKATLGDTVSRRQATPYDRKLILGEKEKEHKKMNKTTYPMATVYHLISGTDEEKKQLKLPWFIQEQVGDWVVPVKSNFEVDNGNRLIIRINTHLDSISEDNYFELRVHGNSSNQNAFFLIHRVQSGSIEVLRAINTDGKIWSWNDKISDDNPNICTYISAEDSHFGKVELDFCLDDITRPKSRFLEVCTGALWPGEDITVNVATAVENPSYYTATFDSANDQLTNSIYGSLVPSKGAENDAHNNQKIQAVETVNSGIDTENQSWGLVPKGNEFYAQIDNSRHLQNLTSYVCAYYGNFNVPIVGAIQTDNIYWTGNTNKNSFTESIANELGNPDFSIYGQQTITDSCFKSIGYNDKIKLYDGGNFKISGLKVQESEEAGLFAHRSDLTIQNLSLENASISSQSSKAGALIGYAQGTTVIKNVHVTGTSVQGQGESGGLIGSLQADGEISDSSLSGIKVISKGSHAAGLIGYAQSSNLNITNVNIDGENTEVIANNAAGGAIGYLSSANCKMNGVHVTSFVTSYNNADGVGAGGLVGYIHYSSNPALTNCSYTGKNINGEGTELNGHTYSANINASAPAGGFIGLSNSSVSVNGASVAYLKVKSSDSSAGGLIGKTTGIVTVNGAEFNSNATVISDSKNAAGITGYTDGESDIQNVTYNGKLTADGNLASGGIIGNAGGKSTVKGVAVNSDVTVTSSNANAAGVVGTTNAESDIENVTYRGKLTISGQAESGGVIGKTNANITLKNIANSDVMNITSATADASGLVGYAQSATIAVENIKVLGKESEIVAKANAGGLFGTLTENSTFKISNAAVSCFIQSESNAGGLIGQLKTMDTSGQLEKSYYGGRTKEGKYQAITLHEDDQNLKRTYTANIHGNQSAGGLIGYIENANGLTIEQCFSTGSVENASTSADDAAAGGFIGKATGVTIKNSYSMGTVLGQNSKNGGFIGIMNNNVHVANDDSVLYLRVFNDEKLPAIGTASSEDSNHLKVIDLADTLKGKTENKDLSEVTQPYDTTLPDQYPYKNWTTDWQGDAQNKIAYYGDWPEPKSLKGEFIYFHSLHTGDEFNEHGDTFKLTGENTSYICSLNPYRTNLKPVGFGIISDVIIQDKNSYKFINALYSWSSNPNGPFNECKTDGSATNIKYSEFNYFGKKYFYYRCTNDYLETLENGVIYVKNNQIGVKYKITVNNGEATFERT